MDQIQKLMNTRVATKQGIYEPFKELTLTPISL